MPTILQLFSLAIAGALGTLARFGLTALIDSRITAADHPLLGTLVVNAFGCLGFGLVLAVLDARLLHADHPTRLLLLTGFMGAFTTFSTYAYLGSSLIDKQQWLAAAAHILAHNALGIALFVVGAGLGTKLAAAA